MLLEQNLAFSISNFWSTGSAHLVNLKEGYSAYQSHEDSMNFPKGFARIFKTFSHTIYFSNLWNTKNLFSKKKLLHSVVNKLTNRYINFWKDTIHDDNNKQPNEYVFV